MYRFTFNITGFLNLSRNIYNKSRLYFDVMILVMPMLNDYISFEIKNEKGYIAGFFEPELNKIFVLGIISKQKGFMKETDRKSVV